jgi:hypothetical protein
VWLHHLVIEPNAITYNATILASEKCGEAARIESL